MKVHVLQHVPFEGIGSMASWLSALDASITYSRFYESVDLLDPAGLDLVIVMGGPMSINDKAVFAWLVEEKSFYAVQFKRDLPITGICLGAQLIASALGARVYPTSAREIG
ncbi:MAG: hypothetical protein PHD01_12770 [Geobacteraceae bacterium]|nr:hypothetical protein [Geobacteraceae bacterium]